MRLSTTLTTAFAATALALESLTPNDAVLLRSVDVLSRPYASLLGPALVRRQSSTDSNSNTVDVTSANITSDVPLNSDGTLNITAWNTAVDAACVSALRSILKSTNPSGNCVCYNLPAVDPETGMFEADLRLYKISEPRDGFAGVKPEDVKVAVAYASAEVKHLGEETTDTLGRRSVLKRQAVAGDPELLKVYMLGGQIDKSKMSENISM